MVDANPRSPHRAVANALWTREKFMCGSFRRECLTSSCFRFTFATIRESLLSHFGAALTKLSVLSEDLCCRQNGLNPLKQLALWRFTGLSPPKSGGHRVTTKKLFEGKCPVLFVPVTIPVLFRAASTFKGSQFVWGGVGWLGACSFVAWLKLWCQAPADVQALAANRSWTPLLFVPQPLEVACCLLASLKKGPTLSYEKIRTLSASAALGGRENHKQRLLGGWNCHEQCGRLLSIRIASNAWPCGPMRAGLSHAHTRTGAGAQRHVSQSPRRAGAATVQESVSFLSSGCVW